MNSMPSLRETQKISTSDQIAKQTPVKNNLGNRFSAEPLENASIAQKPTTTKPSTYERTIQIAKIATAVAGLAIVIFATYSSLSKPPIPIIPICNDLMYKGFNSARVQCMFENGAMYIGPFEDGLLSGKGGSYTNPSGKTFHGNFIRSTFIFNAYSIRLDELDGCSPEDLGECVWLLRHPLDFS